MNAWISHKIGFAFLTLFITSVSFAKEYDMPSPGDDIIGKNYPITVKKHDSLTTIRQLHEVSYDELLAANPRINFYKLRIGQTILIPNQRILPPIRYGIVVNIPELCLYYFPPGGKTVYVVPVGEGRENWRTPLIDTVVTGKEANPAWHVPSSIRNYMLSNYGNSLPDVVPPGPDNPLGKYALHLRTPEYLIHGTDKPTSVGTFISSGCMRLMPDAIQLLFQKVEIGTPVHVIYDPYKSGWLGNTLYLESHAPVSGYEQNPISPLYNPSAKSAIFEAMRRHSTPAQIVWSSVEKIVDDQMGIPEPIGYKFTVTH